LSLKAPTVGGTPRNNPAITRRFASSEQKYTSHSIPKFQTRQVYVMHDPEKLHIHGCMRKINLIYYISLYSSIGALDKGWLKACTKS